MGIVLFPAMGGPPESKRRDLAAKLAEVPHRPGVYLMRDRLGRVIYVGKARDLRRRLAAYFTPSRRARADVKTRALIDGIWDFEVHQVRSEPEALLLEGRLIKEYRPRYNVSFRDDKRFLLVRVDLAEPYPRFVLTRLRREDGARYFGPFAHSGALRATMNLMRKRFGLRSCRPRVPGEADYRHCLDAVIKNCSAPCVGRIDEGGYRERVERACEFLEGESREMIATLEEEMRASSGRLDFERAAQLRDLIEDLRRTLRPARKFTRQGIPSALDPAGDARALGEALGLATPPARMECFDISNISDTHVVASMVTFREGVPDRSGYRRYRVRGVAGQDDFASMGEVVRRRYGRVLAEGGRARLPDLVIVDGGRGQLGVACRELERLGVADQPVIGLAKENEEIYRPGRPHPLRLPFDSGALKLLQRIRDEAHRFANAYHQLLLKRRMAESVLDDCPGVSERRKLALLRAFGSVARLRRAGEEEIARVEGIGPRLARQIAAFLAT